MGAGGRAAAGASANYYAHRPDQEGERGYRPGFDFGSEELTKNEVYSLIEEGRGEYAYRMVLSPGEDLDAGDLREWARDVMRPVEDMGHGEWVGFVHDDHTEHPHVHVVAFTEDKLERQDLGKMRAIGSDTAEIMAQQQAQRELDPMQEERAQQLQRQSERQEQRAAERGQPERTSGERGQEHAIG